MTGIIVCLSAAVMGVDYGWRPVGGEGIEYIIQIEPELLDSLRMGDDIFSDLPASVRNIRSYRITVGTGRLPHQGEPPPASAVVRAGGPSTELAESDGAKEHRKPAEIDLSQLPGPVLGPALFLDARGHAVDNDEPPHIAEAESAMPLRDRTAGYHEIRERRPTDEAVAAAHQDASEPTLDDKAGSKPVATEKQVNIKKLVAQEDEPELPSDRTPEKSEASTAKSALVQLGLLTSLCCNAFLLWVATGQRSRYRALVRRMFDGVGAKVISPDRS